jgi:hypothetical protein
MGVIKLSASSRKAGQDSGIKRFKLGPFWGRSGLRAFAVKNIIHDRKKVP